MSAAPPVQRPYVQRYELRDSFCRNRMVGPHARPLVDAAVREGIPGWRLLLHGRLVGQAADLGRL